MELNHRPHAYQAATEYSEHTSSGYDAYSCWAARDDFVTVLVTVFVTARPRIPSATHSPNAKKPRRDGASYWWAWVELNRLWEVYDEKSPSDKCLVDVVLKVCRQDDETIMFLDPLEEVINLDVGVSIV